MPIEPGHNAHADAGPQPDAAGSPPRPPGAASLDLLASRFRAFEVGDPLYAALCEIVAQRPDWLAMLWHAPRGQQLPNLWLAALHDRVLAGVAHPLAAYFASVGGTRTPDAGLVPALAGFVVQEHAALCATIATRSTQTNETGRCAVLWPALRWIAQAHGRADLALLDFGCSAGLNLGVDRYAYRYDAASAHASDPLTLDCRMVGPHPLPALWPAPHIASRLGIDPAPVDVSGPRALRWLHACIWPGDAARARRLDHAAALARRERWPVRREADCIAAIEPWLDGLPAGVLPVVHHSWVLHYVGAADLARLGALMTRLMVERGVVWLSAEGPHVPIAPLAVPPPFEAGIDPSMTTLWIAGAARGGVPRFDLLARSHAHGRWVEWLAPQARPGGAG
jgi:hypothetical protein